MSLPGLVSFIASVSAVLTEVSPSLDGSQLFRPSIIIVSVGVEQGRKFLYF